MDLDYAHYMVMNEAAKKKKGIPEKPIATSLRPQRTLYATGLVDDYYLNMLDWGSTNVLAMAVRSRVYFWNASNNSSPQLDTIGDELVTSLSWAPDGRHIAVLELLEVDTNQSVLTGMEQQPHPHNMSYGWVVINNDVRVREHVVETYRVTHEVCGLKWSPSGEQLASGGNDKLLHIWDRRISMASATPWLHSWRNTLLMSGLLLGVLSRKICWQPEEGAVIGHERELLSSHGRFTKNQLMCVEVPIDGEDGRAHRTYLQSPFYGTGADATVRIWNVFGDPQLAKRALKAFCEHLLTSIVSDDENRIPALIIRLCGQRTKNQGFCTELHSLPLNLDLCSLRADTTVRIWNVFGILDWLNMLRKHFVSHLLTSIVSDDETRYLLSSSDYVAKNQNRGILH
ncbi:hypothetical protein EZV62_027912 [Acer yangbiense]|uniref:Uncharacterized protein n=1 Tax=Acer yangbiense TaxID=1000413 RepID=A0A5C7GPM7_9ROSI|nr:hypothetical protein EZV62_027912 [Acer yangbiense]